MTGGVATTQWSQVLAVVGAGLGPEPLPRHQGELMQISHALGGPGVGVERQLAAGRPRLVEVGLRT